MRFLSVAGLSLAAAVIAGACTSGGAAAPSGAASPAPSAPPSGAPGGAVPGDADLAGRVFIVTGTVGHDLVRDSTVTLTFEPGRIGITAGCNQMGGAYTIEDGTLVIGPMMMTEMACAEPLMAQDTWISEFLPGAALTLDGATLTLAKGGVTLTATDKKVAQPDLPLEGTTWVVEGIVTDQSLSSIPEGITPSLTFAGGRVAVDTGCNTGNGTARIDGTVIEFGPIGTTKIGCKGPAGDIERRVLAVLAGDVAWTIDADTLQLRGGGGGLDLRARP